MKRIVFFGGPGSASIADYFAVLMADLQIAKLVNHETVFDDLTDALTSDSDLVFIYPELDTVDYTRAEETIKAHDPYNIIHLVATEDHNIPFDTTLLLYLWYQVKAVDVLSISKYIRP